MRYSGLELLWLFFIYSFLGWILETVAAAIRQKQFVNRGAVNSPFCVLYGTAAAFISVFAAELSGIWLFAGSVIMATLFEWCAGHLIEKLYHERWWDYSGKRFHIDGYISLEMSLIWGVLAYCMKTWLNGSFLNLFGMLPELARILCVTILAILLGIDILASVIVLTGRSRSPKRWEEVDLKLTKATARFSHWIYRHVNARIQRAYPKAHRVTIEQEKERKQTKKVFAPGCSFYKLFWLFLIGAFLGDITETIFCRITAGVWMSRSSVVWGPFSIVWGLAIALATLLLHRYQNRSVDRLFTVGVLVGGAYEYICSVFTELVFGKIFWDYSAHPFNLGGRINLLYCFFWGFAAVIWMKCLYPHVSNLIERIPVRVGTIVTWILVIFMCCNMAVSGLALIRSEERSKGIAAEQGWQQLMDEHFDEERLSRIYPNMKAAE